MFHVLLVVIAGISPLVGGTGIMNIMLATVKERTREIGIRRAVGATRQHIIQQFLTETVVLTASGGLLGVVFGLSIAFSHCRRLFLPWTNILQNMGKIMSTIRAIRWFLFDGCPQWSWKRCGSTHWLAALPPCEDVKTTRTESRNGETRDQSANGSGDPPTRQERARDRTR